MPRNLLAALALASCAVPGAALAELVVSPIQWVQGRGQIPHPAINNKTTMLQAIAEGGNCGNTYSYRWDWNGDGDYDDPNETARNAAGNGFFAPLELDVQYPVAQGDTVHFPKVEVTCGAETATAVMPVLVYVDRLCPSYPANENCEGDQNIRLTRRVNADRGIDRSLWYMFKQFRHRADDGLGHAVHACTYPGTPALYGQGHSMNAFLRRGHGYGEGRDEDPYYRNLTQCGLHALLTTYNPRGALWFDDVNNKGTDGTGFSYTNGVVGASTYWGGYEASAWAEPLASFGSADYVAPAGPAGVFGRTLGDIGQDLADGVVQCVTGNGGWYYTCQNGGGTTNDASTNGWSPEALRLLERKMGVETYQFAKDNQRRWLQQNCANGICVYGYRDARLSGNALVGYGWVDDQVFDPANAQHMAHLNSIQSNNHTALGLYYMYASTKGLRSFVPEIDRLPNGRDWAAEFTTFLLQQQAADGSWNWVGGWPWGGSVNLQTRTALSLQIIESWLEVQPYGRASPQSAGPGIDIIFDHSFTYLLDPTTTITAYRWNVVDFPFGLDLNDDGDFTDPGEHAPEDTNGDRVVTGDEIVFEFTTADPDEQFVYAYGDELNWDDVVQHDVLLSVLDSNGLEYFDRDSVRIELSLKNHAPVIVPHPDGPNARYRGYVGTQVLLDGRRSYDVDAQHVVFPGDDARPPGLPDRVTTIHFDLNLDGDFDDPGEDGTNGPVLMTLRDGQGEGDLVSVPMRVCDDGQWNGKCYDGVERADCSECSFGSAPVELLVNVEPPVIDPGPEPYAGVPGDDTPLDLSGTRDPEGVLGLTYRYRLKEGAGLLSPTPGYPGGADDWGPRPIYNPAPDGPRVDLIEATVTDHGGLASVRDIHVNVANIPPVIEGWATRWIGRPPSQVGAPQVTNLGNGWYRVSVAATPDTRWDLWADYQASDEGGDDLTAALDWGDDGAIEARANGAIGTIGAVVVAGGAHAALTLAVTDDADTTEETRDATAPPGDPTLRYFFDVGGDGTFEVAGGGQGHVDFQAPPGADSIRVTGYVRGAGGDPVTFDAQVPLANAPPVFEVARVLGIDGFDVVVSASAVDPDGDRVTYLVDWGDGSEPTRNQGGVGQHTYPEGAFRAYTVTITADDGRGGTARRQLQVNFPPPAANRAPTIEVARVLSADNFEAVLTASASDPDGDMLTYNFAWGDGSEPTVNAGGLAVHAYPDGQFRAYNVTVTVTDGRGGQAQAQVAVDFPPPPANRAPTLEAVELLEKTGFGVVVSATAVDLDGDVLTYTFNWGDGGPVTRNLGGIANHAYANGVFQSYTLAVTVEDGRGGSVQGQLPIDFPAPAANQPPRIDAVRVVSRDGFLVVAAATAVDPDGDALSYSFDWGDGSEPTVTPGGLADHTFPPGLYRAYTVAVTVTDPRGASAEGQVVIDFPAPAANRDPRLESVRVLGQDGFHVAVAATGVDPDGDALSYTFDWGDGSEPTQNNGGVAEHDFPDGEYGLYTVTVTVADGEGGEAETEIEIDFPEPAANRAPIFELLRLLSKDGFDVVVTASAVDPDGDPITYTFDWGDGSEPTVAGGNLAEHTFPLDTFGTYDVTVQATDPSGGLASRTLRIDFPRPDANRPPRVEELRLVRQNAWDVLAVVSAADPDGDALTYTIDWGDGSEPTVNRGGIAPHHYPDGVYRSYDVVATVDDGRGGEAEGRGVANFPEPAENAVPIITNVDVSVGTRGLVGLTVEAWDPEGERLTYAIHWGDEEEANATVNLAGGSGSHRYDLPADGQPYPAYVVVTDAQGASARRDVDVEVVDAPTVVRDVSANVVRDGTVLINVVAEDADGSDFLVYSFDFNGDGTDEVTNQADSSALNRYPEPGQYMVRVTVTDTWSGVSVEAEGQITLQPWVGENGAPVINRIRVDVGPRGVTRLVVEGWDPEGGRVEQRVHWGDEEDPEANEALVGGVGDHTYALPADGVPYAGWVELEDDQGLITRRPFEAVIVDAPTEVDELGASRVGQATWLFTIVARDADGSDQLTYRFDFDGDGNWDTQPGRASALVHTYDEPGIYRVRAEVTDPWSGATTEVTREIELLPWEQANEPPVVHALQLDVGPRGQASLLVDARDPEGGPLDVVVHWGDEAEVEALEPLVGFRGQHEYAFPVDGAPYAGHIVVTDELGASTERAFEANVVDRLTDVRDFAARPVRPGTYLFEVLADDADGVAQLTYDFDFDSDGAYEIVGAASSSAVHTYPDPERYQAHVRVTDSWSGGTAEADVTVGDDEQQANNLAPRLLDVRLVMGHGGHATLSIDATDPDGDRLTYEVDWADGDDAGYQALGGAQGEHDYAWRDDEVPYPGTVRVTDPAGAAVEGSFDALPVDSKTEIREISVSPLDGGRVQIRATATDVDSDELIYAFDVESDDAYEAENLAEGAYLHVFDEAGPHTVRVRVTDPWSGIDTVADYDFELEPWVNDVPIGGDRIEGGEGECLVFRIAGADGQVDGKIDATVCGRDANPDPELWEWNFGDGAFARGSEVGHRFQDDGLYTVTVEGGNELRPLRSQIQVQVTNAAPTFDTQPPGIAEAGRNYTYEIDVSDLGPTDEVRVKLTDGPDGMSIDEIEPGRWRLSWDVPLERSGDTVRVALEATDGHTAENGDWQPDGGEAAQRYQLRVTGNLEGGGIGNGGGVDAGVPQADAGVDAGDDFTNLDQFSGGSCNCDATEGFDPTQMALVAMVLIGGVLRRRRRS